MNQLEVAKDIKSQMALLSQQLAHLSKMIEILATKISELLDPPTSIRTLATTTGRSSDTMLYSNHDHTIIVRKTWQ